MPRYVEAQDRTQSVLFPERLDDWIHEDSTVRVIDVFVEELDLKKLGFDRAEPALTGRPAYSPATLLKIYVYGYLNRVQSSRRLEAEAQRNLELIWLTGRLAPDFKTIADFRRDNGEAIRKVCKEFVLLHDLVGACPRDSATCRWAVGGCLARPVAPAPAVRNVCLRVAVRGVIGVMKVSNSFTQPLHLWLPRPIKSFLHKDFSYRPAVGSIVAGFAWIQEAAKEVEVKSLRGWMVAGAAVAMTGAAQATLIDRGGGMIYDSTQNITWLADMNLSLIHICQPVPTVAVQA